MFRCDLKGWINDNATDYSEIHKHDWFIIEQTLPMIRKQVISDKSIEYMLFFTTKMLLVMSLPEEVMENYRRIFAPERKVDLATPVFPLKFFVPESCKEPIFGMEMYDLLQRSDITLNIHSNLSLGETVNMRMFEATGAGTCLITDHYKDFILNQNDNIRELFEHDSEILTFGQYGLAWRLIRRFREGRYCLAQKSDGRLSLFDAKVPGGGPRGRCGWHGGTGNSRPKIEEGKKRIGDAQRLRWARYRAEKRMK